MTKEKINLDIKLLSPLTHFGDEQSGTMQTLRRMKFFINGEYIDIPVYSGNALRGILRTLVMTDLLEKLDMSTESISQNMFYTLFNGGSLKSGGLEDLSFKRLIREYCPALSLLGSAYGNQMTEGKLKTGILRPVCFEMNEYNRNQTELSLYSGMLSDVFHTRMDRLKKSVEEVSDSDFNTKKQAVQMKYEMETLSAGTMLETEVFVECANELEVSCAYYMLKLLKESGHIGGKSAAGYGKIAINCDLEASKLYEDFLIERKEDIKEFIIKMEEILK